jgi:hypothetical protein
MSWAIADVGRKRDPYLAGMTAYTLSKAGKVRLWQGVSSESKH